MLTRSIAFLVCLSALFIMILSCAGSSQSVETSPPLADESASVQSSVNRYLWAFYSAAINTDTGELELIPVRDIAMHWNVLQFLEQKPCSNCVKLLSLTPSGTGTALAEIQLKHPFFSQDLTGFDVRGICMFGGSHIFPSAGLVTSDRTSGEGELVNPDGYTSLYNPSTEGSGPGGLQGYSKGKMATPSKPNVSLSGYKNFITNNPSNTRNAFYSGDTITVTYEIDMPDSPLGFGYAVDASWMSPSTKPVTDPMNDFPLQANSPEPWKIVVNETPIGDGLTSSGGQTKLTIDVYDRGGKSTHAVPKVECPELFTGQLSASWVSDSVGYSTWEVTIGNTKLASASDYMCLVSVEDNENASAPDWLNLTAYQIKKLTVKAGQLDHHELWYFTMSNLLPDQSLADAIDVLNQAAAAGYEKVVLSDFKLGTIDIQSQTYWDHVSEFVQAANNAGIEIIPSQVQIGYSDAVLCHDPNLIEGQPVRDAEFRVDNGEADVAQDSSTTIINGNFENHSGDTFPGWNQMDGAGEETFADTSIKHGGSCSMRFENFMQDGNGNDRIRQDFEVKPWQCYAIHFFLKTDNVTSQRDIEFKIFSTDIQRQLEFLSMNVQKTQDWSRYVIIFNSQDLSEVALYFGIWGGQSGRFWIDDISIENAGLVNLIRREGAPFVVSNMTGNVTYQEGVDYEYVEDPLMGEAGSYTGTFDLYHEHPTIKITPGSAIHNGDGLLVDYYHCAFVYDMQPNCCLVEDDVFDIFRATMEKVDELINPREVFIGVDEMRCANWCALCQGTGKTPGQQLADATQRIDEIAHEVNPEWHLMTWSDMYDPNHNAHDDYYLVNGTLDGSWLGLPQSWDIGNWYNQNENTLQFFDGLGNHQILCGYYDESGPNFSIDDWLDMSNAYPTVYACMYTTWGQDFSQLEEWAQVVKDWDEANW